MASQKVRYEQLNLTQAIKTYLESVSYSGVVFNSGFQSDQSITNPQMSITFLPSTSKSLQLGKIVGKDKLFNRRVQIDAYMENEPKAQGAVDDLMDFFVEDMCVFIINESN